jgi:hypothetical protein
LTVPTQGHRTLDIAFGILDGAWQGTGQTDGVCFRILAQAVSVPLWQRCLDPKKALKDRGLQMATIEAPENTQELRLETECRGNCNWDWSYWGKISFR